MAHIFPRGPALKHLLHNYSVEYVCVTTSAHDFHPMLRKGEKSWSFIVKISGDLLFLFVKEQFCHSLQFLYSFLESELFPNQ